MGYPACRIYSNTIWEVIVDSPEGFIYFDFQYETYHPAFVMAPEIEKLHNLNTIWKRILRRRYLWGDLNVFKYCIPYYIQKILGMKPEHVKFLI